METEALADRLLELVEGSGVERAAVDAKIDQLFLEHRKDFVHHELVTV